MNGDVIRAPVTKPYKNVSMAALLGGLLLLALAIRPFAPAWGFMWLVAFGVYGVCKWASWAEANRDTIKDRRSWAYLVFWPGMDAKQFLWSGTTRKPAGPDWILASARLVLGSVLLWGCAPLVQNNILHGWLGMIGLVLILHFGLFHLAALAWQNAGIHAEPLMQSPLRSGSLSEFWNRRWNTGFNQLAHQFVFKKLYRHFGVNRSILATFFISGLVHDLVISWPARAGYGLPTLYFLVQGLALVFERTALRPLRVSKAAGWCYAMCCVAIPLPLLFHQPFVTRVILPFMEVLGAKRMELL